MVVVADRSGDLDLVDIHSGRHRDLIDCPATRCDAPSWAPDHRQLAFIAVSRGWYAAGERPGLWVRTADQLRQVIRCRAAAGLGCVDAFTWSPDGSQIAYTRDHHLFIVAVRRDGGRPARATHSAVKHSDDAAHPVWAPNDGLIAFDDGASIYVVDNHGRHRHRVTAGIRPSWSPDGSKLAFEAHAFGLHPTDDRTLYTVNRDGTGRRDYVIPWPKRLNPDVPIAWSPDGRWIVLVVNRAAGGYLETWDQRRYPGASGGMLPGLFHSCPDITWAPDGQSVVFAARESEGMFGACHLYRIDTQTGTHGQPWFGDSPIDIGQVYGTSEWMAPDS